MLRVWFARIRALIYCLQAHQSHKHAYTMTANLYGFRGHTCISLSVFTGISGVHIPPGAIALTRIRYVANSIAAFFQIFNTRFCRRIGSRAAAAACATHRPRAVLDAQKKERNKIACVRSQSSTAVSVIALIAPPTPALLIGYPVFQTSLSKHSLPRVVPRH